MSTYSVVKIYLFAVCNSDAYSAMNKWFTLVNKEHDITDRFSVEISSQRSVVTSHCNFCYWRVCLCAELPFGINDSIGDECKKFMEQYPDYGIAYYTSDSNGDENCYILGLDDTWHKVLGNCLAWHEAHIYRIAEERAKQSEKLAKQRDAQQLRDRALWRHNIVRIDAGEEVSNG